MAFSRLVLHPPFMVRDLYEEPDFSSSSGFLSDLLSDSVRVCPRHVHRLSSQNAVERGLNLMDSNNFHVMLNAKHFKPEELSVKTVDDYVVVHGKHEESADEHGFVSREFTRRYAIPEGVEADKIQSSFSRDGVLTIQAPRKCPERPRKNERVVPITIQQTAAVEQQQKAQEQLQQPPQQKPADESGDAK